MMIVSHGSCLLNQPILSSTTECKGFLECDDIVLRKDMIDNVGETFIFVIGEVVGDAWRTHEYVEREKASI